MNMTFVKRYFSFVFFQRAVYFVATHGKDNFTTTGITLMKIRANDKSPFSFLYMIELTQEKGSWSFPTRLKEHLFQNPVRVKGLFSKKVYKDFTSESNCGLEFQDSLTLKLNFKGQSRSRVAFSYYFKGFQV